MDQYRQGDVWITRTNRTPASLTDLTAVERDNGRVVLAYGEVTGHSHAITHPAANLYEETGSGRRFLIVDNAAGLTAQARTDAATTTLTNADDALAAIDQVLAAVTLDHEEHDTIVLPAGVYEIRIQRQYTPRGIERVAD